MSLLVFRLLFISMSRVKSNCNKNYQTSEGALQSMQSMTPSVLWPLMQVRKTPPQKNILTGKKMEETSGRALTHVQQACNGQHIWIFESIRLLLKLHELIVFQIIQMAKVFVCLKMRYSWKSCCILVNCFDTKIFEFWRFCFLHSDDF